MRGWRRRRPDHQRSSHEIRREGPCCMNLPGAMVSIPIFHIATRSATSFRRRNTGSLTGQPTLGRFRIRAKIGHKVCSKGSGRGSSGSGRLSMSSAYRQSARVAAHIGAGRAIAAQRVGHENAGHAPALHQLPQETLGRAGIPSALHRNFEHIAVRVDRPPEPWRFITDVRSPAHTYHRII